MQVETRVLTACRKIEEPDHTGIQHEPRRDLAAGELRPPPRPWRKIDAQVDVHVVETGGDEPTRGVKHLALELRRRIRQNVLNAVAVDDKGAGPDRFGDRIDDLCVLDEEVGGAHRHGRQRLGRGSHHGGGGQPRCGEHSVAPDA